MTRSGQVAEAGCHTTVLGVHGGSNHTDDHGMLHGAHHNTQHIALLFLVVMLLCGVVCKGIGPM